MEFSRAQSLKKEEKNEKAFNEFNEIYGPSDIIKNRKKYLSHCFKTSFDRKHFFFSLQEFFK